jgi:galactose mutarotase-like enzyme
MPNDVSDMENVRRDDPGVELSSPRLRLHVEPAHGMTITSIRVAGDSFEPLWRLPGASSEPLGRRLGRAGAPSIDRLHELLVGGWFEMSPHAGLPGRLDGRLTMLHGEACRLPWRVTDVDTRHVTATTRAVRYPFVMKRQISVDGTTVTVSSRLRNESSKAWTVSHGEHPCFDRRAFARATIAADIRSARVLTPFDATSASLRSGLFEWPWAPRLDGNREDVSIVPYRSTGAQDHIALTLAGPALRVRTRSGLTLRLDVDLSRHPYVLFWRHVAAAGSEGAAPWDVFALEPQSTLGFGVVDADPADLTALEPGEELSTRVSLTLTEREDP